MTHGNYDKTPSIAVSADEGECATGWAEILPRLREAVAPERFVLCVECYPGAFVREIAGAIGETLQPQVTIFAEDCFQSPVVIDRMLAGRLTDDPVFGRMEPIELNAFLDAQKVESARRSIGAASGLALVVGTAASLVADHWDLMVYANMARWEIQQRQRRGEAGNIGADNHAASAQAKYKRSYFVDWRTADALKCRLYDRIDFLLDTNDRSEPKMISGAVYRRALEEAVRRPFRVVPYFDPGPWGGEWMRRNLGLSREPPNFAWCFDCVPEENSLLLAFAGRRVEIPAIDVVFTHAEELLGKAVYQRFGAEFPIRFDLLDTMGGGNLSLQVHPLTSYIREAFGMAYTQDESYYLLDAGAHATVYLGLNEGVDPARMSADLTRAQNGIPFPAAEYVNVWQARKHDHFLIPGGTVHCSGRNSMVLEISATPYIFTFKLWDWGRLGLDGKPRPIHLEHGLRNIQWNRTTDWVCEELINRIEPLASGTCWTEERTGLHALEFIETRRHWFTGAVPHDTCGTVNVLNLVEGGEAVVESPGGAFDPFVVHYAETFIVPAAVGPYTIRPSRPDGSRMGTIKAFVRDSGQRTS
jgi:mannose-6-phosphate isomerase class I